MEISAVMETCFWGTLGDSKLKYSMILIWLLCMWIQLKNILPSNDLIDIEKDHIEALTVEDFQGFMPDSNILKMRSWRCKSKAP